MHRWKSPIAPTVPAVASKVDFSGLAHVPSSTKKAPKLHKPPGELSDVGSGDSFYDVCFFNRSVITEFNAFKD